MAHFEHKIIQGEGAGKWLPFARQKVAALHARAKAMRVTALVQRWTVEGGDVSIKVSVSGDQRYIHIRRKSCPTFASGLCDLITNPINAQPPLVPIFALTDVQDPSPPDERLLALQRFFPAIRDAVPGMPRAWINEPRLGGAGDTAGDMARQMSGSFVEQTPPLTAGMFTSEMRKVVQILQGANQEIPYSPLYALSHGVFKASNGQRWIIEISVFGVSAWVMGMCRAQSITAADGTVLLDYTPLASPKPEDIGSALAAGTFKFLSDSDEVLDFYTLTPLFAHCGWAFNEDGHEAANIAWGAGALALETSLYKIEITEVDNAPVSATMLLMERGKLAGTKATHMKYPDIKGRLYSFNTLAPIATVSNAPVYCFYEGNQLTVVRHQFSPGQSPVVTTEQVTFGIDNVPICESQFNRLLSNGTDNVVQHPYFTVSGAIQAETPSSAHNFTGTEGRVSLSNYLGVIPTSTSATPLPFAMVFAIDQWTAGSLSRSQLIAATMIVPYQDREAFYLAVRLTTINGAHQQTAINNVALPSTRWADQCIQTCPGEPTQCVGVLYSQGTVTTPSVFCADGSLQYLIRASADYYTTELGELFMNGLPDDTGPGCHPTPLEHKELDFFVTSIPAHTTEDWQFDLYGSGGLSVAMPIPPAPEYLTNFIEVGEVQQAVAVRDAFDGRKYAASRNTVPIPPPRFATSLEDYPVNESTGVLVAFVGVP